MIEGNCPIATEIVHFMVCIWFHYCYASSFILLKWEDVVEVLEKLQVILLKVKVQQGPKYHCIAVNTTFKAMVIKHAEETNKYTLLWKFYIAEQGVWQWRR